MVLEKSTNSLYAPPGMLTNLKSCFIAVNMHSAKQCNYSLIYALKVSPIYIPIFKYIYRCILQETVHYLLQISMIEFPLCLLESLSNMDSLRWWLKISTLHSCSQHGDIFFCIQPNTLTIMSFYC